MIDVFGVLLNVGSNSSNQNGRGRIFQDCAFEYLPIPESAKTTAKVPTYRELGYANVRSPDLRVHLDPEFETFTYGHVKRGFGDVQSLLRLGRDDVLFFFATLKKEGAWAPYIIAYFKNLSVYDCRELKTKEILCLRNEGFENNAHLKRANPHVDFLIKGGEGSRFLKKAFHLAEEDNYSELRNSLRDLIFTATGRKIESGKPWFRWTLTCRTPRNLLELI